MNKKYSSKTVATSSTRIALLIGLALAACSPADVPSSTSNAQVPDTTKESSTLTPSEIAAKGIKATETFPGLANLCDLDMVFRNVNVPRTASPRAEGSREERPRSSGNRQPEALPPMQVFDNLFFLGNGAVSAWLVGSESDGYVLFDALTSNEAAERDIIGGMKTLGLDPAKIKHFIISHGHGDHYGGHRYLSETLGLPVSMSAPDWALVSILGTHPRFGPAPTEGETIEDGQIISLGDTEIKLYVTAAHTPGTISPTITVFDDGAPHQVILWGGTGLNFGPDEVRLREYAKSAARLRDIAREEGVDVFLSNHPARDGSNIAMKALLERQKGDPHPFVKGENLLEVFDVLEACPLAQAERIASGMYEPNE